MAFANYDNATAIKMIHAFVPISRLNKGEAGRIIDEVKADGIRVIVKNNSPECVMISVEEYNHVMALASQSFKISQTPEEEAKRKAFIQRIRQNVPPPIPATRKLSELIKEIGPIDVDENAVNELRRLG